MDRTKSTSQPVYSDPEIKGMERQIKVLRTKQKTVTNTDRVVDSSIVHGNDGVTRVLVTTKDGNVWIAELNSSGKWESALPAVPNTPALAEEEYISELQRKIDKRRKAQGRPTDDDVDEELDEILEGR